MSLVVRADASTRMGLGHVMRCLALSHAWQGSGERMVFLSAAPIPAVKARLEAEGVELRVMASQPGSTEDAIRTRDLAREIGADWIVVDGYQFDSRYQSLVSEGGCRVLLIDDNGQAGHYSADLVLNQNPYAREEVYCSREGHTSLLLGPRYALLRREFLLWKQPQRERSSKSLRLLIAMGGTDATNATFKALEALALARPGDLETTVVVGAGNPHIELVRSAAKGTGLPIRVMVDPPSMPDLMAAADVALSASGSTCWELAYMGVPSLLLVVADNQRLLAESLHAQGVASSLGWHEEISSADIAEALTTLLQAPERRREMALRGRALVDGLGSQRVAMRMRALDLTLREAEDRDSHLIWEWANDPGTRAVSFSQEPIPWERHLEWFRAKTEDPNCRLFVALGPEGLPVGQVRFDQLGRVATVSLCLAPGHRGKGYGRALIWLSSRKMFESSTAESLHAYVKAENVTSARAFAVAGYKESGTASVHGHEALHFCFRKDDLL